MVRAAPSHAKEALVVGKYGSVVEGLKHLYRTKIRPVESLYMFDTFYSPLLNDSDIDARPIVLLLGQYSTGKTTFIDYLLNGPYPGAHVGPEPTTDKFVAVMAGADERVIPGNAAAVQADKPFGGLARFGTAFLSKFQLSQSTAPLLESITLVDTPGVLSGDKQRLGRLYDFVQVAEWFAERADMILLLFDAHKLDISDEFKRVILALRPHDDKIRIVLNKADTITSQQLMRVYGALMWSLGKVIQTPEVMRVYIGSFWHGKPEQHNENRLLLDAEHSDLLDDLKGLPRNAAVRKINELVKRARLVRVHAFIISHLRNEMPAIFGRSSKQAKILANLPAEFAKIQKHYRLAPGDFPDIENFATKLEQLDFSALPKLNLKMISAMDEVLSVDLPLLMQHFPPGPNIRLFVRPSNPFEEHLDTAAPSLQNSRSDMRERSAYAATFRSLGPVNGKLPGSKAKPALMESSLPSAELAAIWNLADTDKDGALDLEEFCTAMQLIQLRLAGSDIPDVLPSASGFERLPDPPFQDPPKYMAHKVAPGAF